MRTGTTLALLSIALTAVAGCSSSNTDTAADSTPTASQCRQLVPFSGGGARGVTADDASQAQKVAASVPLPKGTSLITGRLSTDSDVKDKFAIAIDLCGSGIDDADALRPLATQIAKAYKTSPLSDSIFALYVAHSTSYTDTDVTGQVKLKDADFATHLWNGKPSGATEQQQWKVVGAA